MALVLSRPWHVQPPYSARPTGKLANGLIGAWLPSPAGYIGVGDLNDSITTKTGSPSPIVGPYGSLAWQFASGQYFDSSSNVSAPALAGQFSWAGWVKFAASPVAYGMILTREGGAGTAFEIGTDGSGGSARKPYFFAGAGGILVPSTAVGAEEWHLWHVTVNPSALQYVWYLDGRPDGSGASASTLTAAGAWHVNRRVSGTYASNHAIGPMYAWNRATTAQEAQQLFSDPYALFEPRRIWVPVSAGGSTTYTLSAPTYVPGSITSTGLTARVTVTAA